MAAPKIPMPEGSQYIDNAYVAGTSGETFTTTNPATGELLAVIEMASVDDVNRAVASAQRAQHEWAKVSPINRGRILKKAADILRDRNDELARLEVLDTGKPLREALSIDVFTGADALEYYGGIATEAPGQHFQLENAFAYTRREPLGVIGGIGAWNYPLQIACWKAAPALAAGNAMVFKPSEMTPLTTLKLAEVLTEAGAPAGLFNVVQGDGRIGEALSTHHGIAKVTLTGEASTGPKVMRSAASNLKHLTLELGGKCPLIIFEDCDLDEAVEVALMANFLTQGEVCVSGSRVYVAESIYDDFMARAVRGTKKLKIGNPMDMETKIGSLISQEHLARVCAYIETGVKEGATLAIGGGRPRPQNLANGAFIEPTIFGNCRDDMTIVREEIFAPVMSVLTFTDEDNVIKRANDTPYGLAAGVFTENLRRAHRVAAALNVGMCWINAYHHLPMEVPFGGYKASGIGRENGRLALEEHTQVKSVYVEMGHMPRLL